MNSIPSNPHLNLFHFFNESTEMESIENNLSRAFALCMQNDTLFLNEYIRSVITQDDYQVLFSSLGTDDEKYSIAIQVDTATIEKENYRKVYAVAMTTNRNLDMRDFFNQPKYSDKKNITDIFISIKDVALIIEVKRTSEDCKAQLYNQVLPFISDQETVIPINFSWQEVIMLMDKVKNVHQLGSQNSIFISDFLLLSEIKFPDWFEAKPFNSLSFSSQKGSKNYYQLIKRMRQALQGSAYELLVYDRLGISVPFGWASEIIPEFETHDDSIKDYISWYIWPGNTKQQGWEIFYNPLAWLKKNTLTINNTEYDLGIVYQVKFSHFNRFITGLSFSESDVIKPLHTKSNFEEQSGKWEIDAWGDFEKLMDSHFKPEYKWREECGWEEHFINTDRSYFTMSLGFEVSVSIPYSVFRNIDKKEADIVNVSAFINDIAKSFKSLLAPAKVSSPSMVV